MSVLQPANIPIGDQLADPNFREVSSRFVLQTLVKSCVYYTLLTYLLVISRPIQTYYQVLHDSVLDSLKRKTGGLHLNWSIKIS